MTRFMNGMVRSCVALLLCLHGTFVAADAWESGPYGSDNTSGSVNVLLPYALPQQHDLASVGGVPDQDWFRVPARPNRSYDVSITNSNLDWSEYAFELVDASGNLLSSAVSIDPLLYRRALRWIESNSVTRYVRVTGVASGTAASHYEIALRETTLYCPRFNNAGGQVSVLILQRAGVDNGSDCGATAYFYDEEQMLLSSQTFTLPEYQVKVQSLPAVPGLLTQKGAAAIAHTCGVGGLKAKLVALEPATGFSFDTICTPRDQ